MRTEETKLLPAAQAALTSADWQALDAAFSVDQDPLAAGVQDPLYERLFARIVRSAPAPVGLGPELG